MPKHAIETAADVLKHLKYKAGGAMHKVRTQEDMRLCQIQKIAERARDDEGVRVWQDDAEHAAFVDWGRWIIMCECGAGVAVHPEWTEGYCLGCGAVATNITWPADRPEVEGVLAVRKQNNQFFLPHLGETVESLKQENRDHGLLDDLSDMIERP